MYEKLGNSLLKKCFVVRATVSSKTNYTVTVCANPSCTCQDNRKYGESVFFKPIMFALLKILVITDESMKKNSEKDDLVSMFNNVPITIPQNLYFSFETSKRNLVKILQGLLHSKSHKRGSWERTKVDLQSAGLAERNLMLGIWY